MDVATRAATSRETVSRVERGELRGVPLGTVESIAAALDAVMEVTIRWHGEQLDRLVDEAHARLQNEIAATLRALRWSVAVEVSFNHYGDRGRVDILAMDPRTGALLVVEVKSGLGDLQDTLGRLDVKVRIAAELARAAGWPQPTAVVRALVLADTRTARRTVARHAALFAGFGLRGRSALAWPQRPSLPVPSGMLWFVALPDSRGVTTTRARRVRTVIRGS